MIGRLVIPAPRTSGNWSPKANPRHLTLLRGGACVFGERFWRSPPPTWRTTTTDTKTLLIARLLIACMMAFCMTGLFSLLTLGPTAEWLHEWLKAFFTAWAIAFCLSIFVGKLPSRSPAG
ncbi:DUF2798 domain-containing protein [Rhizobium sp. LjRoot258]|uniref:DUF2798 domain-containing protein n=1 Tax=Rhizobium sp. LjRoot258 TaxID=3342299 RepID=UPI003F4FD446